MDLQRVSLIDIKSGPYTKINLSLSSDKKTSNTTYDVLSNFGHGKKSGRRLLYGNSTKLENSNY